MTPQADILRIAPRRLIDNEPVTTSTAEHFEVRSTAPVDPTSEQFMRIVETSGTLDFWMAAAEDIYTSEDGTPA